MATDRRSDRARLVKDMNALAADLALAFTDARASASSLDGLAVDWSKCYDHLPLDALRAVARCANVPRAIAGPMMAAYAHPRRIVADGQTGHLLKPSSGLPPGCPAATHWLAVLMHCWGCEVRAGVPGSTMST